LGVPHLMRATSRLPDIASVIANSSAAHTGFRTAGSAPRSAAGLSTLL
jgi:hypothetical protein